MPPCRPRSSDRRYAERRSQVLAAYRLLNSSWMRSRSPWPLSPRTFFGMANRVRPSLPCQTLVFQVWPLTVAMTGVRPHGWVTGGAHFSGTGANTQPPAPGYFQSVATNVGRCRAVIDGEYLLRRQRECNEARTSIDGLRRRGVPNSSPKTSSAREEYRCRAITAATRCSAARPAGSPRSCDGAPR